MEDMESGSLPVFGKENVTHSIPPAYYTALTLARVLARLASASVSN